MNTEQIKKGYEEAKEQYASLGIDAAKAIEQLDKLSISIHCWQADDVSGFENPEGELTGGIQATGNYPGKARTIEELKADLEKVISLIPGKHRISLHATYGDFGTEFVDRDKIEPKHFQSWIDWAKEKGVKLDFNSTFFSHDKANSGYTLSDFDPEIRQFWKEHLRRCRAIAAEIGRQQGDPCVHNIWIPDGEKDKTVSRYAHRQLLQESLDEVLAEKISTDYLKDTIECKLFGIGSESYVVGSHEFYMGYTVKNNMLLTLDAGHFHPTETISDKLSSILLFVPEVTLHVSRPERWDSDHVVILNDELMAISQEIVRSGQMDRVHMGLDYFDASINRIGAYVVGIRSAQKATLQALLEPTDKLRDFEKQDKRFERLAYLEELKAMPWNALYNYYCLQQGIPVGDAYIKEIQQYEEQITSKRV
ncbi:MAG: L-rhamnose isomerase [Proteiniphilum sp.]|jgi:L-rhamnose isomerase|nr:L-rhamnose isomerase [Proteiniphilum sp.]NCB26494.1 L-rhamnose isomerase [Bacteroidia bacterium]MDD2938586.1 L-rhamnose isomerase [Proteiniphilum sp.]MDD3075787.1 L-rhamnose isomerase [Proteiniphilum sp.]MDD3779629.1 L-rhamnose isomerase [Proteiniphilum sp.]